MKRLHWVALLGVLLCVPSAFAQQEQDFARAKAAYQEGRYDEAINLYEAMRAATPGDAAIYYNLGNAYAAEGKLGKAIASFERALLRDPTAEDVRFNLTQTRRTAAERADPPRVGPLPKGPEDSWTGRYTPRQLANSALYLYSSLGVLLLLGLLARSRQRRAVAIPLLGLAALAGLSAALLGVVAYRRTQEVQTENRAAIVVKSAQIRRGPVVSAESLFALPEGELINLEETRDGWGLVRLAGKPEGWVSLTEAESISTP